MKEFVMNLLNDKLPKTYYYHDAAHTLYVLDKVVEIARQENCTEKEIELLYAAALWHDVGFIHLYTGHEAESCVLAKQHLPSFGFSADEIEIICGMIMATKMPQSPKTHLEEIIADADVEYLGTKDVRPMAQHLFMELKSLHPTMTENEWNRIQISFLLKHHYFTRFCQEEREAAKSIYLKELQNKI
jgi:uncharacterized protein